MSLVVGTRMACHEEHGCDTTLPVSPACSCPLLGMWRTQGLLSLLVSLPLEKGKAKQREDVNVKQGHIWLNRERLWSGE